MSRLKHRAPVIILCLGAAALFYRLFLGEVLFWGLPLLQFYGWREMAFDLLRGGQLPLWNPLVGNGAPLLANYQTAIFYPPNWLYLILPTEYAMGFVALLHVVWAGLGVMAYTRRLGVERLGQGVAGLAYALSGYVISRFGVLTITSTVAWLGWLLWAVEGLVRAGERAGARRAGWLAAIVALMLLAGHAQTSFYGLLLAGAYAVTRVVGRREAGQRSVAGSVLRPLAFALGAVVLGVMIAAVQLIPTFELMQTSHRAGGVDRLAALSYSFWPWHFLNFALPGMFGSPATGDYWGYGVYWEDAVYIGLLPLVLAVRALWVWWQARRGTHSPAQSVVPFYALMVVPVTVLALGWHTPVFPWLFDHVPTFDLFNAPARWMVLVVFGLSVLAGIGASDWHAARESGGWPGIGTVIGVALLIAGFAAGRMLGDLVKPSFVRSTLRLGVAVVLTGVVGLLLQAIRQRPHWRPAWEVAVLALIAADLVTAHWGLNPTIDSAIYHTRSAAVDLIPDGTRTLILPADDYDAKYEVLLDLDNFRADDAAHWRAVRESLIPNLPMLDGAASASNFDPLLVGHHAALLKEIEALDGEEGLARMAQLNAGLLLSLTPRADLPLAGRAGPLYAYTIPDPWPRAALATCDAGGETLSCERVPDGAARIVVDEPSRVVITTRSVRPAWLVLVDTDYPGWRASLDGEPVTIYRANGAFRAVEVPAGEHEVAFEYRPASVRIGGVVSAAALLVLARLLAPRRDKVNDVLAEAQPQV
ncbi:MAG TPA: YfhO family protein [Aggregatilineales bacterium]|nr:YfhO family protein [Aggregatilineales bacterium]